MHLVVILMRVISNRVGKDPQFTEWHTKNATNEQTSLRPWYEGSLMKLEFTYEKHHSAGAEWESRDLKDWLTDVLKFPV